MADQVLHTIKDVLFYYSNPNYPTLTKGAKDKGLVYNPDDPNANTEYVVKALMSEDDFKVLKKKFKGAKNLAYAKDFTGEEVIEAFHSKDKKGVDNVDKDADYVLVKFSQKARTSKGKDTKPVTVVGIKGKVKDHQDNDISQETIVGNGTKGMLKIKFVDFGKTYGTYLYPVAMCITDLVKYESEGSGSDFEYEELEEEDSKEEESIDSETEDDDFPF